MTINNAEQAYFLNECIPFLNSIGIKTIFRKIENEVFLPGLLIEDGNIIIDIHALLYPGDILHEAGHIAVVSTLERSLLSNDAILASKNRETEEMMAIAWSYAACLHLGLNPRIVFHESGYKGTGGSIVDNFEAGQFLGVPTLAWCNMTTEPQNARRGDIVYPKMKKWVRD